MPGDEKKVRQSETRGDLPMPKYDYQRPATGSFSIKYDEKRERDRREQGDKDRKIPALHNFKLSV